MGIVQIGFMAEKLRGISGLLQAASSCEDKLTCQQFIFSYLSSELSDMADELEYGVFPTDKGRKPDIVSVQPSHEKES